jgi:hypothetical protein
MSAGHFQDGQAREEHQRIGLTLRRLGVGSVGLEVAEQSAEGRRDRLVVDRGRDVE